MKLRINFAEPPNVSPLFKYGMLVFVFVMLFLHVLWRFNLPPDWRHDPNGLPIILLMLLLNHLAFMFRWPATVGTLLRVVALLWVAFGATYVFYWTHVLYP